jgi:hypothetical protein
MVDVGIQLMRSWTFFGRLIVCVEDALERTTGGIDGVEEDEGKERCNQARLQEGV